MKPEKKFLPEIRIYDYNGDLSRMWFIYWYEGKKRIPKYKGINIHKTRKARYAAAKELKAYWQEQLSKKVDGFKGTAYNKQYKQIMYFLEQKKGSWRSKTVQQNSNQLKLFLEWNQRQSITRKRIIEFLDHLFNSGKKQNTVYATII